MIYPFCKSESRWFYYLFLFFYYAKICEKSAEKEFSFPRVLIRTEMTNLQRHLKTLKVLEMLCHFEELEKEGAFDFLDPLQIDEWIRLVCQGFIKMN